MFGKIVHEMLKCKMRANKMKKKPLLLYDIISLFYRVEEFRSVFPVYNFLFHLDHEVD